VLALVALAGGVFVLPKVPAVKKWRADSLATDALREMDEARWGEAQRKVISAFQLAPTRLLPLRAAARLNAAAAHPQTPDFFERLIANPGATTADRLDYADAALRFGDLRKFQKMAEKLEIEIPGDPRLARILARYALFSGDAASAENLYGLAAAADPDEPELALELLSVRLSLPEKRAQAADDLLALASKTPGIRDRAIDAILRTPGVPATIRARAEAESARVPDRPFAGRVRSAELEIANDPTRAGEVLDALRREALTTSDRRDLASLLVRLCRNGEALEILPLNIARNTKNELLVWLDASAGAGNWEEVLNVLASPRLPLELPLTELYSGRAYAELGRDIDSENAYERAARAPTEDPTLLFYLAGYFNRIKRPDLAAIVLRRLTSDPATARPAYESLVNVTRLSRQTDQLAEVIDEMALKWPSDVAVANDRNYLALLRGRDLDIALDRAEKLAAENPDLFPLKITVALGLLRADRAAEALAIFEKSEIRLAQLLPFQRAVFSALLRANGMGAAAEGVAAQIPEPAALLPEELRLLKDGD